MKSNKLRATGALLVVAQIALPACSGMSDSEKKTWGTVGGAVAGAAAGAAIGGKKNRTGGILIGAAVGAGAGYLLASSFGSKATPEQRAKPEFKQAQTEFDAGKKAQDAGKPDEAIGHYEQAAKKAPEQPEPHVNMGYAYLDKEDRVNAEKSFRKALEIDPENAEAKAGLEAMGLKAA
jgi:cytochrome c-type biogenesis protein CcmH/NrfG